jgi:hypothetical protein
MGRLSWVGSPCLRQGRRSWRRGDSGPAVAGEPTARPVGDYGKCSITVGQNDLGQQGGGADQRWASHGSVNGWRRTIGARLERWWRATVARSASTATLGQSSWRWWWTGSGSGARWPRRCACRGGWLTTSAYFA